jgi:energy-converting hydrogenase Eha subunit B
MNGSLGLPELLVLFISVLIMAGVILWPATRICAKAGYSPWLGLLAIIPIGNVFLLWFLAFSEWPARRISQSVDSVR